MKLTDYEKIMNICETAMNDERKNCEAYVAWNPGTADERKRVMDYTMSAILSVQYKLADAFKGKLEI